MLDQCKMGASPALSPKELRGPGMKISLRAVTSMDLHYDAKAKTLFRWIHGLSPPSASLPPSTRCRRFLRVRRLARRLPACLCTNYGASQGRQPHPFERRPTRGNERTLQSTSSSATETSGRSMAIQDFGGAAAEGGFVWVETVHYFPPDSRLDSHS